MVELIDFYSPTAQLRQLTGAVYNHTLVKQHVIPPPLTAGGNIVSNISNMYKFYTVATVYFTVWFTSLYIHNMCIFIMWLMKLSYFSPNQHAGVHHFDFIQRCADQQKE